VPTVYDVTTPDGLEYLTRWITLLQRPADLESIFVPTSCLGSYRDRIRMGSLWPIIMLLAFAAGLIGWDCVLEHRAKRRDKAYQQRGGWAIVQSGLYRVLPLTLGTTFVLVPSTSTRIFRTFLCDRIKYDDGYDGAGSVTRRILQVDLTIDCDSDEYADTCNTALVMLLLWPVGGEHLHSLTLSRAANTLRSPCERWPTLLQSPWCTPYFCGQAATRSVRAL
jgi:hypothetical protein